MACPDASARQTEAVGNHRSCRDPGRRRHCRCRIGHFASPITLTAGTVLTAGDQADCAAVQRFSFRLSPGAVAVDNASTVYVTNQGMYGRVVTLAAGSNTPAVEQFRGLYEPQGVAVDSAGAMYVTDFNNRVVKLAAGRAARSSCRSAGSTIPKGSQWTACTSPTAATIGW
jgi:DNA-binding beta-propeller fold protein YncE